MWEEDGGDIPIVIIVIIGEVVCPNDQLAFVFFVCFSDHFKVFNFIPGYLKEQNAWKVTLDHLFNEYHSTLFDKDPEIIKGQYIQVYEKDSMCGFHQFSGKVFKGP